MGRNDDALKAICKMRDTTLTVPEMRLKAYLMQLVEGELCCYEYLNKRKRHAFEYKEIQIEIILSICRLLLLEAQQTNNREVAAANIKEIEYQLHMVAFCEAELTFHDPAVHVHDPVFHIEVDGSGFKIVRR